MWGERKMGTLLYATTIHTSYNLKSVPAVPGDWMDEGNTAHHPSLCWPLQQCILRLSRTVTLGLIVVEKALGLSRRRQSV